MLRTLKMVFASIACIAGISCDAAPAVFDLQSLASESGGIYLVDVKEVVNPGWRDESGQGILLAVATVEVSIKGPQRRELTFSFKPAVSDQAKFASGSRYVIFVFGPQRPIVLDHQPRGMTVQGEVVDTSGLRGEPQAQPLAAFLARITQATK